MSPGPSLKAWEPETPMFEGRWRWISQLEQREQICPSSAFLFYAGPQRNGWCPTASVRAIFFTQSTDSNINLFQKHLDTHPEIWASLSSVKSIHKITHHIWLLRICGFQSLILKDWRHSMPAHLCERTKAMPHLGILVWSLSWKAATGLYIPWGLGM